MKTYFIRLWNDNRGQSTTEYILILSVVVMVALQFKKRFQAQLNTLIDKVGGQLDGAASDTSAP